MSEGGLRMLGVVIMMTGVAGVSAQCQGPSTAVVVVASVFSTLAVIFLVLGIIAFLVWRRRRGLSSPPGTPSKKNHLQEVRDVPSPEGGVSNPAFSDVDISLAEEGVSYLQCKEYKGSPVKPKVPQTNGGKETSKKNWASLPVGDVPGLQRNGSVGSLDDGLMSMDPEVTSVWLQSQDFIGLGFNIAGSMRDGIFVSQVHNRGPAIESGKFKVGDRIQSVTISFANMVFEDALTILSYASPYPVKVTLQKEHQRQKNRRLSDQSTRLAHPLYRSQSVDTLIKINRQGKVTPKRSFSEMRSETRTNGSPKKNVLHVKQTSVPEEIKPSPIRATEIPQIKVIPAKNINLSKAVVSSDVIVHNVDDISVEVETKNVQLRNKDNKKLTPAVKFVKEDKPTDSPVSQIPEPILQTNDSTDAETARDFVDVFDKLNEEDKLDMLRLSYEDPDTSANESVVIPENETKVEASLPDFEIKTDSPVLNSDYVNIELRSPPPMKPERRKKKNSGEEGSEPGTPQDFSEIPQEISSEDIVPSVSMVSECRPINTLEVSEDFIVAKKHDRDTSVGSKSFQLSPLVTKSEELTEVAMPSKLPPDLGPPPPVPKEEGEDSGGDCSHTLVDYSLSDMESTLTRPRSPQIPIEEDAIMPQFLSKEPLEAVMPCLFSPAGDTGDSLQTNKHHLQDSVSEDDDTADDDDDRSSSENKDTMVEIEKDLSDVDFSLNMTSDPSLFSTPFPKRNTKETQSGVAYDISVQELHAIESEKKKNSHSSGDPKGGIAYVIRDDIVSGVQRTINYEHNAVSKSMSYAGTELSSLEQKQHTGSLKDVNKSSEGEESDLDWSGKRLVRSELFSDIPQNDSVSDWTEQKLDDEGESTLVLQSTYNDNSVTSSEENLNDIDNPRLMRANIFRARENLANLSDNSDSMILTSESTSHSESSTPPPPYTTANGENYVAISPETTPTKTPFSLMDVHNEQSISTDQENNEVITNALTSKYEVSGNGGFNVAVSTTSEVDDTDC
ncbi:uncharacterized protein LOC110445247 [Mizuhopecten yessoensis]|uniref:Periaxin n=1 Tax=Mizuhopecten yessoensis TaxID=6573 RepID=A0A210R0A1_MIZYE|nr:uncharacterized protein LOC110445247 [Mizuhopecten yessoensis]OWF54335.1 Periaxin [Mizuhopecten yessoensis]